MYDQRLAEAYRPLWLSGLFELDLKSHQPLKLQCALHDLVLLVRQPEVRVAGWITVATGEMVGQSDSQKVRYSHTTKQTFLERQETVRQSETVTTKMQKTNISSVLEENCAVSRI